MWFGVNIYIYISTFKIFHHAELERATNHFDTLLGRGGFGKVYYGKKLKKLSTNFNDNMVTTVLHSLIVFVLDQKKDI
jgi:hypothetical protein